jgi:hypothetical protein
VIGVEGFGLLQVPGVYRAIMVKASFDGAHLEGEGDLLRHLVRHVLQAHHPTALVIEDSGWRAAAAAHTASAP